VHFTSFTNVLTIKRKKATTVSAFCISLMPAEGGRKYGKGEGGGKKREGKGRGKGEGCALARERFIDFVTYSRSFVLLTGESYGNLYNLFMDSLQLPYEVSARIQSKLDSSVKTTHWRKRFELIQIRNLRKF